MVDEIVNDSNSTNISRPYAVQRKRLFDDSDELFAADQKRSEKVLNESINPPSPKNPKIQVLIDEIINDTSLVKPHEMKIPLQKKSVLSVAEEKTLPPAPPGTVVAAVFQEMAAVGSLTSIEEEKVYPKESSPRTKCDIIGYSEVTMKVVTKHLPITAVMKNRKMTTSNPRMK